MNPYEEAKKKIQDLRNQEPHEQMVFLNNLLCRRAAATTEIMTNALRDDDPYMAIAAARQLQILTDSDGPVMQSMMGFHATDVFLLMTRKDVQREVDNTFHARLTEMMPEINPEFLED